jgi:hypothetical protein
MRIILSSRLFKKAEFDDEIELEKAVWSNPEVIFGGEVIYVPQKSIETVGGISTIPDGIAINLSAERWYIVEVELARHGTWNHIAPQVNRQIVAAENPKTKKELVKTILGVIQKSEKWVKKFTDNGIPVIQIQSTLERVMEKLPVVVVVIDAIPQDLLEWSKPLKNDFVPVVIEKYVEDGGNDVAYRTDRSVTVAPIPVEEEEKGTTKPPVSEEAFLKQCDEPGRMLYKRLKELAKEKKHELKPSTQSFSYYVVSKNARFCLLTLWFKSVTIIKYNIHETGRIPVEAASRFRDEIVKIGNLENRYDTQEMPSLSTRDGELSEYEIELFVSAFKRMIDSIA